MEKLTAFKRLWSFPKGTIKVIVADCYRNERQQYRRTGPGDMKALLTIRDSLEAIGHNNVSSHFADVIEPEQYEKSNLILIGGYKNNAVTQRVLEEIKEMSLEYMLPYSRELESQINTLKNHMGSVSVENHFVSEDSGIILKLNSPFDRSKMMFVLFGITNFGTAACGTLLDNERMVKKVVKEFSDGPFWLSFRVNLINQSVADNRIEITGPGVFKNIVINDLFEKSHKVRNVCTRFLDFQKAKETRILGTGSMADTLPESLSEKSIKYLSDILNLHLLDKNIEQIAKEIGGSAENVQKDLNILLDTFKYGDASSRLLDSLGVFSRFKPHLYDKKSQSAKG